MAALCAASIGATGCDKLGLGGDDSPTAPSGPPPAGSTIRYVPLGASDVSGYGSSVPCVPYTDCPNGTGYAFVAARQLRSQGYTVAVTNIGVPTAVISRRFQDLGRQYGKEIIGNLIDQEMPFIPSDSTLVTIFAGANDVNVITAALGAGAGGSDRTGYLDQQVRNFGDDYATLLSGIRAQARSARIVLLNVPNIAGMPFLFRHNVVPWHMLENTHVNFFTPEILQRVLERIFSGQAEVRVEPYAPVFPWAEGVQLYYHIRAVVELAP